MSERLYRVDYRNVRDCIEWWGFYVGDDGERAVKEFLQLVSMGREARIHSYEVPDAIVR
jgi:radical SAM superfamily enzyme YgiQ (UPF0313 family)